MKIDEPRIIQAILKATRKGNMDNISRTAQYGKFYFLYPEIKWSFLAHFVSRNAGWNMTDLKSPLFATLLREEFRQRLFLTYERANWLIFRDAYPQLLTYHYSTKFHRPLFHLLKHFHVSSFMIREWEHFWVYRDEDRLLTALIINEQNVIQNPIIIHPFYQKKVFQTVSYRLQQFFHYSMIVFPTKEGKLYGVRVKNFLKLDERIETGKVLSSILFHPKIEKNFIKFLKDVTHTGSRYDFEKFLDGSTKHFSPYFRFVFPVVKHKFEQTESWNKKIKPAWFQAPKIPKHIEITDWYKRKRKDLELIATFCQWVELKKKGG